MTTFTTFTKRLAARLSSFRDPARVRDAAKGIQLAIDQECSLAEQYGFNGGGIHYLAGYDIPLTRTKQNVWLNTAIENLNAYTA